MSVLSYLLFSWAQKSFTMNRIRLILLLVLLNLLTDGEVSFRQQRFCLLFGRCLLRTDWPSRLKFFLNFLSSSKHISGWCLELNHDRLLLHPLIALILRHPWPSRVELGQVFLRLLQSYLCQYNSETSILVWRLFTSCCVLAVDGFVKWDVQLREWFNHSTLHLTFVASSHKTCMTYAWCCMYSLRLLMMDGKTFRNM